MPLSIRYNFIIVHNNYSRQVFLEDSDVKKTSRKKVPKTHQIFRQFYEMPLTPETPYDKILAGRTPLYYTGTGLPVNTGEALSDGGTENDTILQQSFQSIS